MKVTEQYFPLLLFIMLYKVSNVWVFWWNPKVWPFKVKATENSAFYYFSYVSVYDDM